MRVVVFVVLCGVAAAGDLTDEKAQLRLVTASDEWGRRFGAPRGGVLVADCTAASVWERAGLLPGTIILTVDGKEVKTPDDFWKALVGKKSAKLTCAFGALVEDVLLGKKQFPGGLLLQKEGLSVFWLDPSVKVAHDIKPPSGFAPCRAVMAKNEYEPLQIAIRAKGALEFDWKVDADAKVFDKTKLLKGVLLPVTRATTLTGCAAKWVDPLITAPQKISLKDNPAVLWLLLHTKKDAPAGHHTVTLTLRFEKPRALVLPIKIDVAVCNFALPDETHTRTAIGLGFNFKRWHGPVTKEQQKQVWEKYLSVMAEHRLSPYKPFRFLLPLLRVDKKGQVHLDTTAFVKEAPNIIRRHRFNSFMVHLPRKLGRHKMGDPQYEPLLAQLLKIQGEAFKKAGLEKLAFCYWVDEPAPERFAEVKRGMRLIKKHAPWLARLLTFCQEKAPCREFEGFVDIWVPVLHLVDPAGVEAAHKRGEQVWFYVCCIPRGLYPNLFIDEPGIDHRLLFWLAERWNLDGFLYWSATFWRTRNPWEQTQSLVPHRKNASFGAGDGLLLYPPSRKSNPKKPVLAGPVVSYRMEMLREGLEDREYFWLLRRRLATLRRGKTDLRRYIGLMALARRVLGFPARLAPDATSIRRDVVLLRHARAILASIIQTLPETIHRK